MKLEDIKEGQVYYNPAIGGISKYLEIVKIKENTVEMNFVQTENNKITYKSQETEKRSIQHGAFTFFDYKLAKKIFFNRLFSKIFSGKIEVV